MEDLEVGNVLKIDSSTGYLKKGGDSDIQFKVVKNIQWQMVKKLLRFKESRKRRIENYGIS
jgi:hypothetical protein